MIKIMFISLVLYMMSISRVAVSSSINEYFSNCNMLLRQNIMGVFWNEIKQARSPNNFGCNSISLNILERLITEKFS